MTIAVHCAWDTKLYRLAMSISHGWKEVSLECSKIVQKEAAAESDQCMGLEHIISQQQAESYMNCELLWNLPTVVSSVPAIETKN